MGASRRCKNSAEWNRCEPVYPCGRHFRSMDRRAGLGGRDAKRKQGSRRDDAKCHPECSIHELREKAYSYQREEFRGQGELSDRPQRVGWGLALCAQSKTIFLMGNLTNSGRRAHAFWMGRGARSGALSRDCAARYSVLVAGRSSEIALLLARSRSWVTSLW